MIDIFYALIPGLIIGIIFGFVLQRGRFCMNSAFRDIIVLKDYKLIKSVTLAILVSMLGFAIMFFANIINLNPKGFAPIANIVGGLVFGVGMVLAAGCASGTTYRVGEGMMGSVVALFGFSLGAYFTKSGALTPIRLMLQDVSFTEIGTGAAPTLFGSVLTPIFMLIIGIVGIAVVTIFWIVPELKKRKDEGKAMIDLTKPGNKIFKQAWHWAVVGIVIGIIAWVAYVSSAAAGRNYPLGITGGWIGWLSYWITQNTSSLGWETWLVLGVVGGAFISALIAGEFKLRLPKEGKTLLIQLLGGFAMGFGAVVAMGCNIGNTLSGIPHLSIGSWVATGCIILGCWIAAYFMFMREKD